MNTESTIEMEVLPRYHTQPVAQGPTTYWQRCGYNILGYLRTGWNMIVSYRLVVTMACYTTVVISPSAPTFDVLTLYKTPQGCLILILLLLLLVFLLQRLNAIMGKGKLQSV
ncbi:hypothetical protein sscle_14g097820 [Sclerotinia sclerotiorum 1980 UF-70]|nr:hypothetical protein sscle_14g097820 [Sclerotinia sclerotiorum 1980 UF-70]